MKSITASQLCQLSQISESIELSESNGLLEFNRSHDGLVGGKRLNGMHVIATQLGFTTCIRVYVDELVEMGIYAKKNDFVEPIQKNGMLDSTQPDDSMDSKGFNKTRNGVGMEQDGLDGASKEMDDAMIQSHGKPLVHGAMDTVDAMKQKNAIKASSIPSIQPRERPTMLGLDLGLFPRLEQMHLVFTDFNCFYRLSSCLFSSLQEKSGGLTVHLSFESNASKGTLFF
jgi:hypothetical protein